jgi:hypothetical protein
MHSSKLFYIIIALAASPAWAQITISVDTLRAEPGAEAIVAIRVQGATGIGAFQTALTYDPAVLEIKSVDKGELLKNALLDFNPAQAGRVMIGLAAADGISGDGVLVECKFLVIGQAGHRSPLTLVQSEAWAGETRAPLNVNPVNGELTVWNPRMVPSTTVPPAVVGSAQPCPTCPPCPACPTCPTTITQPSTATQTASSVDNTPWIILCTILATAVVMLAVLNLVLLLKRR